MKKLLIFLALGLLGLATALAQAATEAADADGSLARGEYIAHASNCIACHSFQKGPYAGGTPFGNGLYSPNITPDNETGIGSFPFEGFDLAVRQGISPKRGALTVMMPPSYAIMADQDIKDLYQFFMHGVPAVKNEVQDSFARKDAPPRKLLPFKPAPDEDLAVARGRYLIEGLGHCGFCHTPRDAAGAEKAQWASDGPEFLSGGGNYAGWIGINLHPDQGDGLALRSAEDLKRFFLTGRNEHTAVFGKMIDVVENSTRYLTAEDAAAMAAFLKSLPLVYPGREPFREDRAVAEQFLRGDDSKPGAAVYLDSCASCHRIDGSGYTHFFPELRGNPVLMSQDPVSLIHITLMGQTLPGLPAAPSSITMPPFGWRLDDRQIADVVTFIRSSWGNQAPAVSPEDASKVRGDKSLFPDPRIFGNSNVDKLLDKQY